MESCGDGSHFGFGSRWDLASLDRPSASESSESYGGLEFRVSLIDLANRLQIDADATARSLYVLRKKNVLSYSMSDSKIYLTILRDGLSSSIRKYQEISVGQSSLSDANKRGTSWLNMWIWSISERVNNILAQNVNCVATRVLDMWRVGKMICSLTSHGSTASSSHATADVLTSQEKGMCSHQLPESLRGLSAREIQRTLNDFVCDFYIGNLAPKKSGSESDETDWSSSEAMGSMVQMFYELGVPIIWVENSPDNETTSFKKSQCSSHAVHKRHRHSGLQAASRKVTDDFLFDIRALSIDVRLHELIAPLLSFDNLISDQWIPIGSPAALKSLFIAKIFHGLSSNLLQQQDWLHTGLWGRYSQVDFQCIIGIAERCLNSSDG